MAHRSSPSGVPQARARIFKSTSQAIADGVAAPLAAWDALLLLQGRGLAVDLVAGTITVTRSMTVRCVATVQWEAGSGAAATISCVIQLDGVGQVLAAADGLDDTNDELHTQRCGGLFEVTIVPPTPQVITVSCLQNNAGANLDVDFADLSIEQVEA